MRPTAASMSAPKSSGSMRSPRAVEPTTSANSAVTTRRVSAAGAGVSAAPQREQKRASAATGAPQVAHPAARRFHDSDSTCASVALPMGAPQAERLLALLDESRAGSARPASAPDAV